MRKIFLLLFALLLTALNVTADDLKVTATTPADGTEMANLPASFTVTFDSDAAIGYGKWMVVNANKEETADDYVLTQGQLKKTDGVWGGKVYFNEACKMYEGTDYQLVVYTYNKESDQDDEETYGSNAFAKINAATWKGTTKAYQYAAAELQTLTPSSGSIIVSGEITTVFTAPVETLTADIGTGTGANNIPCQTTPSEDKMTWTIMIPESVTSTATGAISMNVYAKDADGKVVKGNAAEDENSYFVWEFNCYNACPLPQKVTPADGSTVEKIDVITIEDANGINISWNALSDIKVTKGKQEICTVPVDSVFVEEVKLGGKPTKVTIKLPQTITDPGTYQVLFPALYFMIGEETSSLCTKNFTVEYTIEGEEPGSQPADVTIKTVKPSYMEITFKDVVTPSWNATATVTNAAGEVVANNCAGDYADDWNDWYTAKIKFGTDLAAGDYKVNIPAGMFVFGESGTSQNEAMTISFTVEGGSDPTPGDDPTPSTGTVNFTSSPADGSTVESIKKVTLTFPDAMEANYTQAIYTGAVKDAAGETICGASLAWGEGMNQIVWEAGQKITENGTYTITIPAGAITLDNVATTADIVFTLTIGETPAPAAINFTSDPANGSIVESIQKITFTFTDANEADMINGSAATVVDANGNSAVKMTMLSWGVAYNQLVLECNPVTDAGTYTITLPAGTITLDGVATTADVVIKLTIDAATGINAVSVNGSEAVRYTISGKKAAAADKGIIIINGKKVVIK